MVWYFYFFKNFPHFVVIHTVKGLITGNEAEVDFFFWNPLAFSVIQGVCWQFDIWFPCIF